MENLLKICFTITTPYFTINVNEMPTLNSDLDSFLMPIHIYSVKPLEHRWDLKSCPV